MSALDKRFTMEFLGTGKIDHRDCKDYYKLTIDDQDQYTVRVTLFAPIESTYSYGQFQLSVHLGP